MTPLTDIAIIGPGKVGTTLGLLAARAGLRVAAVGARRADQARDAADLIGGGCLPCTPAEAAGAAPTVLLTVSDSAIATACQELAQAHALADDASIIHCSGVLASDVLAPARDLCGCSLASMHPLQTFPTVDSAVAAFPGTFVFCEGDEPALARTETLVNAIGGRYVAMATEGKALYHAAACTTSNALAALIDAALAMFEAAGIDRATALQAAAPLLRTTADNIAKMGPARALTGPVARGDAQTLQRHVNALAGADDDVRELYLAAARQTIALAQRKGTLDESTAATLRHIVNDRRKGTPEHGSTDH